MITVDSSPIIHIRVILNFRQYERKRKGTHSKKKKKKKKEVSPSFEYSEKNTARSRNVVYLDQRSFKHVLTCLARRFRFFHLIMLEILAAGETGPAKVRKNMGELRKDLSQSDKLISALLPAYTSIYCEKKLRLDRGTTNQSDSLLCSHEGKSEINLSLKKNSTTCFYLSQNLFSSTSNIFYVSI